MAIPVENATPTYKPSLSSPKSNAGTVTTPATPLLLLPPVTPAVDDG